MHHLTGQFLEEVAALMQMTSVYFTFLHACMQRTNCCDLRVNRRAGILCCFTGWAAPSIGYVVGVNCSLCIIAKADILSSRALALLLLASVQRRSCSSQKASLTNELPKYVDRLISDL